MQGLTVEQAQMYLSGVAYPATKEEILDYARMQGDDMNVLKMLEMLPDMVYDSPREIEEEIERMM